MKDKVDSVNCLEQKLRRAFESIDPTQIKEVKGKQGPSYELNIENFGVRLGVSKRLEMYTPDAEPYSDVILTTRFIRVRSYTLNILHKGRVIKRYSNSDFTKRMYSLAKRALEKQDSGLLSKFEDTLSKTR